MRYEKRRAKLINPDELESLLEVVEYIAFHPHHNTNSALVDLMTRYHLLIGDNPCIRCGRWVTDGRKCVPCSKELIA